MHIITRQNKPTKRFVQALLAYLALTVLNACGGNTNIPAPSSSSSSSSASSSSSSSSSSGDMNAASDIIPTASTPTIWYASDSTVRHYEKRYKIQQGVGQRLPEFLNDEVSVANYAKGGRAISGFEKDGFWNDILNQAKPGDVILIQFGINDRGDVPNKEVFKDYLRSYTKEARAKQAIPVFVTPTPRNQHRNGVFTNAFQKYCDAKFEIGEEMDVTVIDLQSKGRDYFSNIGPGRVSDDMMIDTLHLGIQGAYHMARLLAEGISESKLSPLRDQIFLDKLDPNLPPSEDGWVPRKGYSYN